MADIIAILLCACFCGDNRADGSTTSGNAVLYRDPNLLKNLSLHGWFSAVICALLCAIFSGVASLDPRFVLMEVDIGTHTMTYTNYTNSTANLNSSTTFERSYDDDDDNQGVNDVCWNAQNTFWPSKLWSISLTHGICFENIPRGDSTQMLSHPSVSNITFDEAIGTSSFTSVGSFYCWEWDQKLTGSLSSGTEIYSNEGYLFQICESTSNLLGNSSNALLCSNWENFRSSYQSAKVAADIGIVFSVITMIVAFVGAFFLVSRGSESSQTLKTSLQLSCGILFMIIILIQIVVQSKGAVSSINPYTKDQNVEAIGCQPAYLNLLNDDPDIAVSVGISTGSILSILSIIMAAIMGGICLTPPSCYNNACFPCCFAVYIPTTQTSIQSSPNSIQLTTTSVSHVTVVNSNAGAVYQV